MTIRMYDTRARALVEFLPVRDGEVSMYVCGPTVQSSPHIGHVRSALVYDLWRRWFGARGARVTLVRNVTDIDDKVLLNATHDEPWFALAYRMELEFTAAYQAIGVLAPTYEPRATASIPQMIDIIARLIERGHAYPALDGSADVYFDTASWPRYGELTNQRVEDMAPAPDADPRGKRDPRDFALWKASKADEPDTARWQSPWGEGRPGWHIECSAMSRRYLGTEFDIHGGGLDLRFPHHENELAQSTASGDAFARYWVHNGLVNVGGEKMSKSLGNSVFARDLLREARPIVVRYWFASSHYRSVIDYRPADGEGGGSLAEAETAFSRIEGFLQRAGAPGEDAPRFAVGFAEAMDDDLSTPQAFAVLHDTVRQGNAALDAGDAEAAARGAHEVRSMLAVLGLDPADAHWQQGTSGADDALAAIVERLIAERQAARADKDWATADRMRDVLDAAGIVVEDGRDGTTWSIA